MAFWLQHLVVFAIVAFALFVTLRNALSTLRRGTGKFGSCCAKGCTANESVRKSDPGERIVFLPVESLTRRHRS
jgi:hypothetical protein